ncbi:hypothetical protein I4F81_000149 [Pyropia yezoensis]|uniref:Uncharacterized protein n=1 Tax=Pyropia yezoensis TaxID=2788 RepID=A0ACC3BJ67_PYRYE|nr:hypothetical protein I4F81_000149 [Neopyropia yezoensis]
MGAAHGGSAFFPWHRLFLLEVEEALSVEAGERVALPFWPWAYESADLAGADVWAPFFYGGAAPGACIPDGPFATVTASQGRCIVRGFSSTPGGINGFAVVQPGAIQQAVFSSASYEDFATVTEVFHNELHVALGGDMVEAFAPDDPIFFAHHAYVDRWWAARQQVSGNPNDYGGAQAGFVASPSDALDPFGRTVSDTFSLPCVAYGPLAGDRGGGAFSGVRVAVPDAPPAAVAAVVDAADSAAPVTVRQAPSGPFPRSSRSVARRLVGSREDVVRAAGLAFAVAQGASPAVAAAARDAAVAVQVAAAEAGLIDISRYGRGGVEVSNDVENVILPEVAAPTPAPPPVVEIGEVEETADETAEETADGEDSDGE